MKDLSYSLAILLSFTLVTGLYAQKPIEKTLIKSFNLQGYEVLDIYLDGDTHIEKWDSPIVRVEMAISLLSGCRKTLNMLIKSGKYDLIYDQTSHSYRISMRGLTEEFKIPGACLKDLVSYRIKVPRYVNVREGIVNSTAAK